MAEHGRIVNANRDRLPAGRSRRAAGTLRPMQPKGFPSGCAYGRNSRGRGCYTTDFSPDLSHTASVFISMWLRDLALSASYERMFAIPPVHEASFPGTTEIRTHRPIAGIRPRTTVSGIAGAGTAATRSRVTSRFLASRSRRFGLPRASGDSEDIRGNCGLTSQLCAVKVKGVSP